jgi:hypothetical protein
MANPEALNETQYICVRKLFYDNKVDKKCSCPHCTGRGKRKPLKADIEFPELITNATKEKS